jgi:diaminopimelate epimerase
MKIPFTKMHGLGNDFIIIDCRRKNIRDLPRVVKRLSRRRFGIGFDQALILRGSKRADFRMDVYNSDGSRVEMCGNGIRCMARYIWTRGLSRKRRLAIETLAGIIRPERANDLVRVDMGVPVLEGSLIPAALNGLVVDHQLSVGDRVFLITGVSMGNPHCVIFVDQVDAEFVEVVNRRRIKMRVWERGSGETLACGTGAAAAAVASHIKGLTSRNVTVCLRGGELKINRARDDHVYLTGPAEEVFVGTLDI